MLYVFVIEIKVSCSQDQGKLSPAGALHVSRA